MPKSFLIAIVYCLFWNSVSVSQISIRSAYNESAAEALTKSDFEKAEKLYRLAIKEAGSLGIPDDTQIESILGLSEILLDTDRIPEARQMLDGALKAFEKRVQARKTDDTFYSKLTELLSRRTRLHLWDNEVAEARSRYQHWIELMEAEFESRFDFKFASLIEDYSQLCEENGDFSEVEKVYEKWISIASAQESPDPHDLAEIKMELASHYLRNSQNIKAEEVYKELLEDVANDSEKFIFEIPDILQALADIYQKDDRAAEAEAVLKQLLRVEETSESKIGTANALESLADLYITQSKYSDAESLLGRSLALYAESYKEYASAIIKVKLMIARCHAAEGDERQAKKSYDDVLSALDKRFQNKQNDFEMILLLPEALTSVARFYEQNGKAADVELLLNQWIDRIEQSSNPDQSLRFVILRRLADFYQAHDRGMEAETLYKKRLDKAPDDSTVGQLIQQAIRGELAIVYLRNENFANATEEMKTLIDAQIGRSRLDKRLQSQQKYILATLLEIQGNRDDAIKTEHEAIEVLRKDPRRLNVRVVSNEEKAGDNLFEQEAFREAEERYSSAIFAALLAFQDDPKALNRLNEKLGRTVAAQKRNKEAKVYFRRSQRIIEAK